MGEGLTSSGHEGAGALGSTAGFWWRKVPKLTRQAVARRSRGLIGIAALVVTLTGCSADSNVFSTFSDPKHVGLNMLATDQPRVRAIQPRDLIGPDGHCADDAAPATALNFQAGPDASVPGRPATAPPAPQGPAARGIGLEMTECEVERTAGYTDRVEITNDPHGRRHVVLTYVQGEHAGIYRFEGGRLKSIERSPDAPLQAPTKPSRNAKKSTSAANPTVTPGAASGPAGPPASR